VVTGVAFFFYGMALAKSMNDTGSQLSSKSFVSHTGESWLSFLCPCYTVELARKMTFLSVVMMLCFLGESIMWILSVVALEANQTGADADTVHQCLFYVFDLGAICAVLYVFAKAVSTQVHSRDASTDSLASVNDEKSTKKKKKDLRRTTQSVMSPDSQRRLFPSHEETEMIQLEPRAADDDGSLGSSHRTTATSTQTTVEMAFQVPQTPQRKASSVPESPSVDLVDRESPSPSTDLSSLQSVSFASQ